MAFSAQIFTKLKTHQLHCVEFFCTDFLRQSVKKCWVTCGEFCTSLNNIVIITEPI